MNTIIKSLVAPLIALGIFAFGLPSVHADENAKVKEKQTDLQEERAVNGTSLPIKKLEVDKKKTEFARYHTTEQEEQSPSNVERTVHVEATAYTAHCDGCIGITKTGINLLENPNKKVIAVDPNVIPLGSEVYVEGYGRAIAGDIGSAIQGNRIDLYMKDHNDAMDYGRRQDIKVEILSS
ncbi:3D domain-containing protein [Pontibacillus salipaludis]|uniref:3D domain-containing protein n=1 Tax=Pontibacillus salipaludis TaxID=1697394 RepID=UPI0031EB3D81